MSGIDRLRTLAGEWDEWGLGGTLAEMADQIERERACDEDAIENIRLIVGGVIDDMERHVSGVEGAEDSPVARWARELREALKSDTSGAADAQKPSWHDPAEDADVTSETEKVTRDQAEDVSMSAYDLLPADERDAIAWVREHGGLDHVKAEWRSRVPHDRYARRRQRLLRHIAECETALGRRNRRISEPNHLELLEGGAMVEAHGKPTGRCRADYLTHQRPVLDAYGVPIREGDTVYLLPGEWCDKWPCCGFHGGEELEVFADGEASHVPGSVQCREREKSLGSHGTCYPQPSQLTHTKPAPPESWDQIKADADLCPFDYAKKFDKQLGQSNAEFQRKDLVRRAKALAERERGEA